MALGNNHYLAEERLGNLRVAKEALVSVLIRDPANLKALLSAARLGVSLLPLSLPLCARACACV